MKLSQEQEAKLKAPLPSEAIKQHPSKTYLSTIRDIYVIERLNEVFGVGSWKLKVEHITTQGKMVVVKVLFTIPEYNIEYECYGGNDNSDLGDAYKGATTDALTKICSWLGIANEVWKNKTSQERTQTSNPTKRSESQTKPKPQPKPIERKVLTIDNLLDEVYLNGLCNFLRKKAVGKKLDDIIRYYYDCDEEVISHITNEYLRKYGNPAA